MKEGEVDLQRLDQKYNVSTQVEFGSALRNQQVAGYIEVEGSRLKLTRKGLLQVDSLLPEYFEPQHRAVRYT
ncbi:MAG UNVERIFIED_CONTAM: hypothetical protein LVR18_13020 [Planctomycetaceae bacterium]|jgi:oxygen-independent coproporphyrinogen-3 oxidase